MFGGSCLATSQFDFKCVCTTGRTGRRCSSKFDKYKIFLTSFLTSTTFYFSNFLLQQFFTFDNFLLQQFLLQQLFTITTFYSNNFLLQQYFLIFNLQINKYSIQKLSIQQHFVFNNQISLKSHVSTVTNMLCVLNKLVNVVLVTLVVVYSVREVFIPYLYCL